MTEERRDTGVRREEDLWKKWDTRIRDSVLFVVGVVGIINELFYLDNPRADALVFLSALVGLPFIFAAQEKVRKGGRDNDDDE